MHPSLVALRNLTVRVRLTADFFCACIARRLERIMKEVLDDFGEDSTKLEQLLTGHRIKLAEDLSESSLLYYHIISIKCPIISSPYQYITPHNIITLPV